jgi:hypothetical protein
LIPRARTNDHGHGGDWPNNYGSASAGWRVFILTILQIVSMIDRQVISVLAPDIRADLGEGSHHNRAYIARILPSKASSPHAAMRHWQRILMKRPP